VSLRGTVKFEKPTPAQERRSSRGRRGLRSHWAPLGQQHGSAGSAHDDIQRRRPSPSSSSASAPFPAIWWAPWESNPAPTDYETRPDRRWGSESRRTVTDSSASHHRRAETERIPNLSLGSVAFRTGKPKRIKGVGGGGPNRFRTAGPGDLTGWTRLIPNDCYDLSQIGRHSASC